MVLDTEATACDGGFADEKDDFVEAAMTMTVPLEVDEEGGFGTGGPDGVGSGGRATARPPSLRVHRDAMTRSRRPQGAAHHGSQPVMV